MCSWTVDDRPAIAGADHRPRGALGADERPGQVDVDRGLPVVERVLEEGMRLGATGVVDEDVDTAKLLDQPVDRRARRSCVGKVQAFDDRPRAVALDLARRLLAALAVLVPGDSD